MMSYQVGQKNKFVDWGVADTMQLELLDYSNICPSYGHLKKIGKLEKNKVKKWRGIFFFMLKVIFSSPSEKPNCRFGNCGCFAIGFFRF